MTRNLQPDYSAINASKPIKSIEIWQNDVVIRRSGGGNGGGVRREDIAEFSRAARKRLAFVASNTAVVFTTMITLTYPARYESDGAKVKDHLQALLKRLRRHVQHGLSYLWFLEFQRRGAPHYHILLDCPVTHIDRQWLSAAWYEVVDSKDILHHQAGTRLEKLRKPGARYAIKYAQKMRQKMVPERYINVGRFYGYSRDVEPEMVMELKEGNIDSIFRDVANGEAAIKNGWAIAYNCAAATAVNVIEDMVIDAVGWGEARISGIDKSPEGV